MIPVLALSLTYDYKNNARTGKPDLVTTVITTGDVGGLAALADTLANKAHLTNYSTNRQTEINSKVASVAATLPVVSSGGTTPTISLASIPFGNVSAAVRNRYPAQSTMVNGYALSSNVVVSASDLTTGTLPHGQLPALVSGDIPNNAANTSGTAAGLSANITESQVTGLVTDLAAKASLANPVFTTPVRLKGYTVATLPTGTQGDTAFVTDALAPTFLATIVGGGAVKTPVFFNGTVWVGY